MIPPYTSAPEMGHPWHRGMIEDPQILAGHSFWPRTWGGAQKGLGSHLWLWDINTACPLSQKSTRELSGGRGLSFSLSLPPTTKSEISLSSKSQAQEGFLMLSWASGDRGPHLSRMSPPLSKAGNPPLESAVSEVMLFFQKNHLLLSRLQSCQFHLAVLGIQQQP